MTPKQRAKIYRKAAEGTMMNNECCCYAIYKAAGYPSNINTTSRLISEYIEFEMFRPHHMSMFWWEIDDQDSRTIAMLLCEQIALNP